MIFYQHALCTQRCQGRDLLHLSFLGATKNRDMRGSVESFNQPAIDDQPCPVVDALPLPFCASLLAPTGAGAGRSINSGTPTRDPHWRQRTVLPRADDGTDSIALHLRLGQIMRTTSDATANLLKLCSNSDPGSNPSLSSAQITGHFSG